MRTADPMPVRPRSVASTSAPRPAYAGASDALAPPAGRSPVAPHTVPPVPQEPRRWSAPASEPAAAPAVETDWGKQALDLALRQIQGARYDAARATLAEIQARYPDSSYAREASKGSVALYNAKRIKTADSDAERARYRNRARRDLGTSMWGRLFS